MSALANLSVRLRQQASGSPLGQRWQQLPPRDRLALIGLGGFFAVVMLYLLIWQPLQQQLHASRNWYAQQRELHQYVLEHAEQARQVAAVAPQQSIDPDALQGLVTSSAQAAGLTIERVDSDSSGLQVNLTPSAFVNLLPWLQELHNSGVGFSEVSLERGENGLVLARLSLVVGG
jgi:general secretion pathway protein M